MEHKQNVLLNTFQVDAMRIADVREAVRFSRDHALRHGPIIMEFVTYRYYGHSISDPGVSYRSREEIKLMQTEQDPITLFTKFVVQQGLLTEKEIEVVIKFFIVLSSKQSRLSAAAL